MIHRCVLTGLLLAFSVAHLAARDRVRVLCLGDSHSTIEAGASKSLAAALGGPVDYAYRGVNGTRASDLWAAMSRQEGPFSKTLNWAKRWSPSMILIAFGTNEGTGKLSQGDYEVLWDKILNGLSARFPGAKIVVVGPPDADPKKVPHLQEVVTVQKTVAERHGVACLDRRALMGGPSAFQKWVSAGYARPDGVHLTPVGYARLERQVANALRDGVSR